MKAVIDTSVLIAALLSTSGYAYEVFQACQEQRITLLLSKAMIDEAGRVLHKPKIQQRLRWQDASISLYLRKLRSVATFVQVADKMPILDTDPTDSIILACAVQGEADVIVSLDQHLLSIGQFAGIPILTPLQAMQVIAQGAKDSTLRKTHAA